MTDAEFMDRAEALLQAIERACDDFNESSEADIDNQRSGGMVTLTFANRSQIVVNLQKPLHEVWLAAKSGGYHYKFSGGNGAGSGSGWFDTKNPSSEFFANLSAAASAQAGLALCFLA